jgi:hypothetical protein
VTPCAACAAVRRGRAARWSCCSTTPTAGSVSRTRLRPRPDPTRRTRLPHPRSRTHRAEAPATLCATARLVSPPYPPARRLSLAGSSCSARAFGVGRGGRARPGAWRAPRAGAGEGRGRALALSRCSAGAQPVGRALSGWERGPPLSQPDSAQPGGLGLCQAEAMASLGLRLGCAWWL